jgi:5-formyltetrahydrofolate cyclo-ligase
MRDRLASLSPDERARLSADACAIAAAHPAFANARAVLLFDPLPDEIDARPLIVAALSSGKRVALPRVDWDRGAMTPIEITTPDYAAETRRYSVREPGEGPAIDPQALDLILVPALAFDRDGRRLGRGKGFYDRFLTEAPPSAHRLGLAYEFQIVQRVPAEPHDERVHAIATDHALHLC